MLAMYLALAFIKPRRWKKKEKKKKKKKVKTLRKNVKTTRKQWIIMKSMAVATVFVFNLWNEEGC